MIENVLFDTIARAAAVKARATKQSILLSENSHYLREYLKLVLDPQHNFYMTLKGLPPGKEGGKPYFIDDLFYLLKCLRDRKAPAAELRDMVARFLGSANPSLRGLFNWAIDRQLPGNIGETVVNNCFPGLIYHQPYGGVSSFDPEKVHTRFKWSDGVMLQKKADGLALFVGKSPEGEPSAHTRQGQDVTEAMLPFLQPLYAVMTKNEMIQFEMGLYNADWSVMDRLSANGHFNAIFQGDANRVRPEQIWLTGLDTIQWDRFYAGTDHTPCNLRYVCLHDIVINYVQNANTLNQVPNVTIVESHSLGSFEAAMWNVRRWIRAGEEGGVLKDPTAPWKDTRMTSQMKLKNEFDCTLRVVDWVPHTKHKDWVGSLVVASDPSNGKVIKTKVGSGLNEDQGSPLYRCAGPDAFIGKCIDVKAEKVSKNLALQHPRVIDVRLDRRVPDTYARVREAEHDSVWKD